MTDTPSSILLLRLQSVGSNTNLWGGYLNTALQTLEQASKGYQSLAVTGSATISWTNYSTGNVLQCAFVKLTGALSAPASLTAPAYNNFAMVWNNTGATVTVLCSGGVGVAIPTGRRTLIYCDGVDYYTAAPDWTGAANTLTNNGDLPTYAQVQVLIANATTITSPGQVRNSASDTTAGFLSTKLVVSGLMQANTGSPAGNETDGVAPVQYTASGTDTYAISPIPALTAYGAGNAFFVLFTNANTGAATLNVSGLGAKAITKNGATALVSGDIPAACIKLCSYDGTQFQIVPTPAVFTPDDGQTMFYNAVFLI